MARTLDRKNQGRASAEGDRDDDAFLTIDRRELEKARRDPRRKAFANAARNYWRKAAPKSR